MEGKKGQAEEKKAGGGGESAQLHPDLGGEGRGGSLALSWPHEPAPRVPFARGSPTRNPGTRSTAFSSSLLSQAETRPRPAPPAASWVEGWALKPSWAGTTEKRREGEHALLRQLEGRSSLCNEAGKQ